MTRSRRWRMSQSSVALVVLTTLAWLALMSVVAMLEGIETALQMVALPGLIGLVLIVTMKERRRMHPAWIVLQVLVFFGWWLLIWVTGLLGVIFGGFVILIAVVLFDLIRPPSDRDHPLPSTAEGEES